MVYTTHTQRHSDIGHTLDVPHNNVLIIIIFISIQSLVNVTTTKNGKNSTVYIEHRKQNNRHLDSCMHYTVCVLILQVLYNIFHEVYKRIEVIIKFTLKNSFLNITYIYEIVIQGPIMFLNTCKNGNGCIHVYFKCIHI